MVSQAGKNGRSRRGDAAAPVEVARRICRDVEEKGLEAVLDYARIDWAELAETIRVSASIWRPCERTRVSSAVRQVRDNIVEFQQAILHKDGRSWLGAT
jgi:histidinol dehydrogenase